MSVTMQANKTVEELIFTHTGAELYEIRLDKILIILENINSFTTSMEKNKQIGQAYLTKKVKIYNILRLQRSGSANNDDNGDFLLPFIISSCL